MILMGKTKILNGAYIYQLFLEILSSIIYRPCKTQGFFSQVC
ncbi:hypothetical protein MNBD_GAMMA12-1512 [hydrothermal vent metagenome]|uniref:Uncharacterized protein n=1 Tax=hydrothermal vent metagenome TaxID=652676 RepID=A0A3B0Z4W0_9ZZZZ